MEVLVKPRDEDFVFAAQKQAFFDGLKKQVEPAMALHEANGLWNPEDDWSNVTDHCLLQAARVGVMADLIGLDEEVKQDLVLAAAVHDAYKKEEVTKLRADGLSWDSYMSAQVEAEEQLKQTGFSAAVIEIARSVAHETVPDMWAILQEVYESQPDAFDVSKIELSDIEKAKLIMHYSDDYTVEAEWAKMSPAGDDPDSAGPMGPLEERMRYNETNEKYQVINVAGTAWFGGAKTYVAQRAAGIEVERLLTDMINKRNGTDIRPEQLPIYIDQIIVRKMQSQKLVSLLQAFRSKSKEVPS